VGSNSFIHIEHLYSASSRKLLRSAPNTSTVKQSSLKVRKKRRWSGSVKNAKFRREAVSGWGAHHGESNGEGPMGPSEGIVLQTEHISARQMSSPELTDHRSISRRFIERSRRKT